MCVFVFFPPRSLASLCASLQQRTQEILLQVKKKKLKKKKINQKPNIYSDFMPARKSCTIVASFVSVASTN
eukprot:m.47742 g.47742  ORF g.47742 m.47742 type:complete len:71 (-) comp17693_c0_seq1:1584-1796(-)